MIKIKDCLKLWGLRAFRSAFEKEFEQFVYKIPENYILESAERIYNGDITNLPFKIKVDWTDEDSDDYRVRFAVSFDTNGLDKPKELFCSLIAIIEKSTGELKFAA